MPVGLRLSVEEEVEGGYEIDEMIGLVRQLEGMGMDFVDVSTGIYESLELLIQPMDLQQGCLLPLARRMKQSVSIPVFGTGRIDDVDLAEKAVSDGGLRFRAHGPCVPCRSRDSGEDAGGPKGGGRPVRGVQQVLPGALREPPPRYVP